MLLENGSFPPAAFFTSQYKVVYCCIETQFQQAVIATALHSLIKS
jgi:hypothetical protein